MPGKKKDAKLLCAYLIVGADELKRETAVTRLKARLEPGLEAFNLDERTATADLAPNDVLTSLDTMPMGQGFRLVIVRQAERLPKPVSEALVRYLADPNPGCVLCLVAGTLSKATRLYKAVAKVGPHAVIDCTPLKRWRLPDYLQRHARATVHREIDRDAAEELVARVGEDTTMLDRQLRTLADLCRGSGPITLADVEAHVARTAEVKPWEFLDAVSARDAARALELYNLMRNTSEIALLTLLTTRVRELVCAKALDARGEGALLAKTLGRQAWQVKNHLGWARRFSMAELEGALAACARCERALKGGSDACTSLTTLVLSICGS